MTDKSPRLEDIPQADWVTRRHRCTAKDLLGEILEQVKSDVESMNRESGSQYQFDMNKKTDSPEFQVVRVVGQKPSDKTAETVDRMVDVFVKKERVLEIVKTRLQGSTPEWKETEIVNIIWDEEALVCLPKIDGQKLTHEQLRHTILAWLLFE